MGTQTCANAKYRGCFRKVAVKTTTDAGHGDNKKSSTIFDSGTNTLVNDEDNTSITGIYEGKRMDLEKDYALKVEERIDYWLYVYGIDNQRTRYDNYIRKIGEERILWRYQKANATKSVVFVSIHLDSGSNNGFFLIYNKPKREKYSNIDNYNAALRRSEESEILGKIIKDNMAILNPRSSYNARLKDVVDDTTTGAGSLGVLRCFEGKAAVVIELCGIESTSSKRLISEKYDEIGKSIAIGIYKYLFGEDAEPQELRNDILNNGNSADSVGSDSGGSVGSQHWTLNNRYRDCDAALNVSNGEMTVTIETPVSNNSDIQLVRNDIPLEQNIYYRLIFEACAKSPAVIEARVDNSDSRKTYSLTEINLAPQWDRYEMIFSTSGVGTVNTQLVFNLGMLSAQALVKIRNVRLFGDHHDVAHVHPVTSLPQITLNGRMLSVSLPLNAEMGMIRVADKHGKVHAFFDVVGSGAFSLRHLPAGVYLVEIMGTRSQATQIVLD